jgi:beta-aspartyl-peptidase (threonine type)
MLSADAAEQLARGRGLAIVDPSYFSTQHRLAQLHAVQAEAGRMAVLDHDAAAMVDDTSQRFGTVGAVARDRLGHLAAATSTGGLTNKMPGRISDPRRRRVSRTYDAQCRAGGEHLIRACLAHDVHARMRYCNRDVERAAHDSIMQSLQPVGGRGGVIAVGRDGRIAMRFNTPGMYRAWVSEGDAPRAAIFAA